MLLSTIICMEIEEEEIETSSHHQCQHLPGEQIFSFHMDVFVTHSFKEIIKIN